MLFSVLCSVQAVPMTRNLLEPYRYPGHNLRSVANMRYPSVEVINDMRCDPLSLGNVPHKIELNLPIRTIADMTALEKNLSIDEYKNEFVSNECCYFKKTFS